MNFDILRCFFFIFPLEPCVRHWYYDVYEYVRVPFCIADGIRKHLKSFLKSKFVIAFICLFLSIVFFSLCRSESPSSQRSSPPISPGCEDQMLDSHEPFKKPLPPMRPQEFPPFYSGYPYHLMQHGSSAFHRPIDASGKPLPVQRNRITDENIPLKSFQLNSNVCKLHTNLLARSCT